ncbi:MAG: hypothetical protein O3B47_03580 [bacterium]|nr:hypothetical protein [bacterium]
MKRQCKQCKGGFEITDEDLEFYKKISPKFGDKSFEMPLPTLCPDCRNQRRQMFRNDRSFYLRKCDLSGERFVSMYQADCAYKVYKPSEWFSDKWNPLDYGRDFDFKRPFFEQFGELMKDVPRMGINIVNCENSDYCNYCSDNKNCYMDIAGEGNEDCYFNLFVKYSKNTLDCTFAYNCELCYECINCYDCYGCQNCMYCDNCSNCYFSYDLKGCQDCIFSYGLRNKQYYIFNEEKTKEEYEDYFKSVALDSFDQREKMKEGWAKFKKENAIFRANYFLNCENCSGNNIKNSKNTFYSFNVLNCEDCAYLYDVLDAKDCRDLNYSLYKPELSYELISSLQMVRSAFSMASHYNNEVFYCDHLDNCSNLLGCIGLNHAKYCILNKQYSKEEYNALVPQIIEKMVEDKEWGEFFPAFLSPHAYNETVAQEYFPLTPEKVHSNGWRWTKRESGNQFKIIPQELKFYEKMGIPSPAKSPDQRHRDRIDLRTPRRLWERACSKCNETVLSAYKPDRPEKIFCDKCYFKEVY